MPCFTIDLHAADRVADTGEQEMDDEDWRSDTTQELADRVSMPIEEFLEVFGGGWRLREATGWSEREDAGEPWHLAGEPPQLALRASYDGVELGMPAGEWEGACGLGWTVQDQQLIHADALDLPEQAAPIVARLLKRRRSGFRYCRYCREIMAPERSFGDGLCQGCAGRWLGVVY